jgi:death on curing protein
MTVFSLEHLLEIHTLVIQHTGGSDGLRDLGRLESVIALQTQNVFGQELYETVTEKAAAMIRALIADHPFVDGNKRTAMLVGLTFLKINGATFNINQGEIEDFAVKIATEHLNILDIDRWLRAHIA